MAPGNSNPHSPRTRDILKRFYREYMRPYKWRFICTWFFVILLAFSLSVPPYLIKLLIDNGIQNEDMQLVWIFASGIAGTYIAVGIIDKIQGYVGFTTAQEVTYNLRNDFYSHIQKLSFTFYDNARTGELLSRIVDDLNVVERVLHNFPKSLLHQGGMVLFGLIMSLYLNWKLALASYVVVPCMFGIILFFTRRMMKAERNVRQKKASLASSAERNISGMRLIQAFIREPAELQEFARRNEEHYWSRINVISNLTSIFPTSVLFLGVSIAIAGVYGGHQVMAGVMSVGTLAAFIMYLQKCIQPLIALARLSEPATRFMAGIERFFNYMDIEPDIQDAPDAVKLKDLKGRIDFEHVWFKYEREDILKDINLHVEEGSTVALVGPSGAGKTTVTRLIPRFYEPYRGHVRIDGHDIQHIKLRSLRKNIAIVMQNEHLLSDTLGNNIAYGRPNATWEEMLEAARKANVDEFAAELPYQYETELGEKGVKVSEGQAQRIAIARAILKDAPILILDEATSSVDSQTERLIQQALDRLLQGKTALVIAHRLSTIREADKIVFVDEGTIQESGTHDELMAKNGRYAHFYNMQFRPLETTA